MDLLAAIKREERKLEKELGKLQRAAKALGGSAIREVIFHHVTTRCNQSAPPPPNWTNDLRLYRTASVSSGRM